MDTLNLQLNLEAEIPFEDFDRRGVEAVLLDVMMAAIPRVAQEVSKVIELKKRKKATVTRRSRRLKQGQNGLQPLSR